MAFHDYRPEASYDPLHRHCVLSPKIRGFRGSIRSCAAGDGAGLAVGRAAGDAGGAALPRDAVNDAVNYGASRSVTEFISVLDRNSGQVLAQTGNANTQVASESIMKLLLASYYL